ncbi:MAG: hypothetical protein PHQ23_02525 [Candidatus Wallbacteria bacterium]|nr:hypothetical protein [Candidatus Wallbacteria bacterium]
MSQRSNAFVNVWFAEKQSIIYNKFMRFIMVFVFLFTVMNGLAIEPCAASEGIVLSAGDLFSAYSADRRYADALYTNQWIFVRGRIQSVCCNPVDGYQVVLKVGPYRTAKIDCGFAAGDFSSLFRLRAGDEVRIFGRCLGLWDRAVLLSSCRMSM